MQIGDVVQFNENHEWRGCLGIINEIKECKSEKAPNGDIKYMVGVPVPNGGTAFIFVLASEFAIEKIGKAKLIMRRENDD